MRQRAIFRTAWLLGAVCWGRTAWGGESGGASAAPPPAEAIDRVVLNNGARASLAVAVEYLRKQALNDADGWVLPPTRNRKVVGHTEVIVRHSKVKTQRPVYEYEYEKYEVLKRGKAEASIDAVTTLKKVVGQRVKSAKQVGVKEVERLVRDPDGPISVSEKRPIYGPGGPDFWPRGYLGHNAMALYAMRKAGVSADDEAASKLARNLTQFMDAYGMPDWTWDLAWFTAAFSVMPGTYHRVLAETLAGKLLDGQIMEGDARGMWGPVSINTALLVEALRYQGEVSETLIADKKRRNEKGLNPKDAARLDLQIQASEDAMLAFKEDMRRIAMLGMRLDDVDTVIRLEPEGRDPVSVVGLADYIYNQVSSDIESTALALFALRVAAENEALPVETYRPVIQGRKPIHPAQTSFAVLARAANALAAAQNSDGGWDEMNRHQPVRHFDRIAGMKGTPVDEKSFVPLKSGTTLLSAAQGWAGLLNAGHAAGLDRLLGKFAANVANGSRMARRWAERLPEWDVKREDPGGYAPPYDAYLYLLDAHRKLGAAIPDREDLWARLSRGLLLNQGEDGAWRGSRFERRARACFHPSSLTARIEALHGEKRNVKEKLDRSKAHVHPLFHRLASEPWRRSPVNEGVEKVLSTASAMLFLLQRVRPPPAGECRWTERAGGSEALPRIVSEMRKRYELPFAAGEVGTDLASEEIMPLAALFIRGDGEFELKAEAAEALAAYLKGGGLVFVEAAATAEGARFLRTAQARLARLTPGGKMGDIGKDKKLLGDIAGKVRLDAIRGADGEPLVVFLPIRVPAGTGGGLTAAQAASGAFELMMKRLDPAFTQEDYPINLGALGEPRQVLAEALAALRARGTPARAAEGPGAVEEKPEVKEAEGGGEAAPRAEPAPDEVW